MNKLSILALAISLAGVPLVNAAPTNIVKLTAAGETLAADATQYDCLQLMQTDEAGIETVLIWQVSDTNTGYSNVNNEQIARFNTDAHCGSSNWALPRVSQMQNLVGVSSTNSSGEALDNALFLEDDASPYWAKDNQGITTAVEFVSANQAVANFDASNVYVATLMSTAGATIPTTPILTVADTSRSISWAPDAAFPNEQYEYRINATADQKVNNTGWVNATENHINLSIQDYSAGAIEVRIKAEKGVNVISEIALSEEIIAPEINATVPEISSIILADRTLIWLPDFVAGETYTDFQFQYQALNIGGTLSEDNWVTTTAAQFTVPENRIIPENHFWVRSIAVDEGLNLAPSTAISFSEAISAIELSCDGENMYNDGSFCFELKTAPLSYQQAQADCKLANVSYVEQNLESLNAALNFEMTYPSTNYWIDGYKKVRTNIWLSPAVAIRSVDGYESNAAYICQTSLTDDVIGLPDTNTAQCSEGEFESGDLCYSLTATDNYAAVENSCVNNGSLVSPSNAKTMRSWLSDTLPAGNFWLEKQTTAYGSSYYYFSTSYSNSYADYSSGANNRQGLCSRVK